MLHRRVLPRTRFLILAVIGSGISACLLFSVCCPVGEAQELKIGYVNLAKVFDQYERTKVSDSVLEKKGQQKENELQARVKELQTLRGNLELLSAQAREAKAREIEEKAEDIQRFRNRTARDLRQERDQAAKEILDEIQQAVDQYAQANGFTFILDQRALLYGQQAADVTTGILELLKTRSAGKR